MLGMVFIVNMVSVIASGRLVRFRRTIGIKERYWIVMRIVIMFGWLFALDVL